MLLLCLAVASGCMTEALNTHRLFMGFHSLDSRLSTTIYSVYTAYLLIAYFICTVYMLGPSTHLMLLLAFVDPASFMCCWLSFLGTPELSSSPGFDRLLC